MKIRYWIKTNKVGSKCEDVMEIDDDEWNAMTDEKKEDTVREAAFDQADWGYVTELD
jgi:hypothetical protein